MGFQKKGIPILRKSPRDPTDPWGLTKRIPRNYCTETWTLGIPRAPWKGSMGISRDFKKGLYGRDSLGIPRDFLGIPKGFLRNSQGFLGIL